MRSVPAIETSRDARVQEAGPSSLRPLPQPRRQLRARCLTPVSFQQEGPESKMEKITTFKTKTVVLPTQNIDTDQIIPARFLKVTDKKGLGKALFSDWRYDKAGNPNPDFVLNRPEAQGARVLVGGDNFGCGSSREHA